MNLSTKNRFLLGLAVLLPCLLVAFESQAAALVATITVTDIVDQLKAGATPIVTIATAAISLLAVVAVFKYIRGAL